MMQSYQHFHGRHHAICEVLHVQPEVASIPLTSLAGPGGAPGNRA